MITWSKLSHPNILSLLGYIVDDEYPCLISEWMENGTVRQYLETHPELDILNLVGILPLSVSLAVVLSFYRHLGFLKGLNTYMTRTSSIQI